MLRCSPPLAVFLGMVALVAAAAVAASPSRDPGGTVADGPVVAAEPRADGMTIAGQIGGSVRRFATDGDWIYVTDGSRVVVIDGRDPNEPRTVGRTAPLARVPTGLAADGGFVHVPLDRRGYQVIDATDPTAPRAVAYLDGAPSWPWAVAASGRLTVIWGSGSGEAYDQLAVFDVSTPGSPIALGTARLPNRSAAAGDVAIVGDSAWIARSDAIDVVDLTDPRRPKPMPTLAWPAWEIGGLAAHPPVAYVAGGPRPTPPSSAAARVALEPRPSRGDPPARSSGTALAAASEITGQSAGSDAPAAQDRTILRVLDVATPGRPQEVVGVRTDVLETGEDVAASSGLACVLVGSPTDVLRVYDVSPPEQTTALGEVEVPFMNAGVRALGRDGTRAALATDDAVTLVDLADPLSPRLAGSVPFADWEIWDVEALGGYAYVVDRRFGLRIVDARDPFQARHVGDAALPHARLEAVAVADVPTAGGQGEARRLAYAVGSGRLVVLDVTDPATPHEIGSVAVAGAGRDIAVAGDHAYVAAYDKGLQIVDVSDPTAPRLVASLVLPSGERPLPSAFYVAVEGSHAYVGYKIQNVVQAVDVSDPEHPREVARIGGMEPTDIAAADGHLYVVGWSSHLDVYDVGDPSRPRQVGYLATHSDIDAVALAGPFAYIADDVVDGKPVLLRIDVSDPRDPRVRASLEVPGSQFALAVDGDTIFVADVVYGSTSNAGLTIVRAGVSVPPSPTAGVTTTPPDGSPSPMPTEATATRSVTPTPTETERPSTGTPSPSRTAFVPFVARSD